MDLLTRRRFMRQVGLAGGTAAGFPLLGRGADNPPKPLTVVVVGAGLAGLVAAYELEKAGHTAVLLEADPKHLGGRVRTHRFADGRYGELGPMRIPKNHNWTRHYVKEFGLTLRKFVQTNDKAYLLARGTKVRQADAKSLADRFKLAEWERGKSPDDLWERAVGEVWKKLTADERQHLFADTPKTPTVRALDRLSLRQLFERAGMSDEGIEYLAVTQAEETLFHTAATEVLRDEVLGVYSQDLDEIEGGTDLLPRAFVKQLKKPPRLGCEVTEIRQNREAGKVEARFTEGGKERSESGDFLICTIPFAVIERVKMVPEFSPEKRRAIRVLHYESATKVLLDCTTRFWEQADGIYGGGTITDLPAGMTYYPSDNTAKNPKVSAAGGVLLASYTWGMAARRLAAGSDADTVRHVVRHLSTIHSQVAEKDAIRDSAVWNWDRHRWAGGAFCWFLPGQHTELHRHIVEPEGRVILAGEHTSLHHSWMQGALESGRRAVHFVLNNGRVPG